MASWQLDRIAARLKEAAINMADWPDVLGDLGETIGGSGAVLFSTDVRLMHAPSSHSLQMTTDEYFRSGWDERDIRYSAVPLIERKGIISDLDVMPTKDLARSDFYQDFLHRNKCDWFAGIGFRAGGDMWCLSVQRGAAQGPFQRDELQKLKTLWRPFSDAATLSRVLDQAHIAATTDALEHIRYAALVCDDKGRIVRLNAQAAHLMGPMIDMADKTLKFRDAQSAARFHTMIASALKTERIFSTEALTSTVLNPQGKPLLIRAVCLEGKGRFMFSGGFVLLLVKPQPKSPDMMLTQRYRLTPTEIRIAKSLSSGASVQDIAAAAGVKIETVRTQLKSIFSKTDTHSQGQLVALLSALQADKDGS